MPKSVSHYHRSLFFGSTPVKRLMLWMPIMLWSPIMLAVGTVASAQPAPPPPKPAYLTLRFDEQWTLAQRTSHWDDAIKAIPLIPGHPVTLTVAGQARWREEFMRQYNLSNADDDYGQSRLQLSADLQVGQRTKTFARLFTEVRDAQSYGRTLPGKTRSSDADRHDVQNLFADLGYKKSWLRYGRQEIALNRERLMGVPDWANTRRASEGLRVHAEQGSFVVEATDARPVIMRQELPNRGDSTSRFRTLSLGGNTNASSHHSGMPSVWQAYWYQQTIDLPAVRTKRNTTGARSLWQTSSTTAPRRYGIEFEGALQNGSVGPTDVDAWFWVVESTIQWRHARGAPSLALGIEEASGNRASTTATNEAFNTLYSAAHSHGGIADVIGRTNARELHALGSWSPVKLVELRGGWYRFDRLQTDDGIYTKGNTLFRAANGSEERHAADEWDLSATWKATRHVRVIAGGAIVVPGTFLKTTAGGANTEHWGFLGTTFTF